MSNNNLEHEFNFQRMPILINGDINPKFLRTADKNLMARFYKAQNLKEKFPIFENSKQYNKEIMDAYMEKRKDHISRLFANGPSSEDVVEFCGYMVANILNNPKSKFYRETITNTFKAPVKKVVNGAFTKSIYSLRAGHDIYKNGLDSRYIQEFSDKLNDVSVKSFEMGAKVADKVRNYKPEDTVDYCKDMFKKMKDSSFQGFMQNGVSPRYLATLEIASSINCYNNMRLDPKNKDKYLEKFRKNSETIHKLAKDHNFDITDMGLARNEVLCGMVQENGLDALRYFDNIYNGQDAPLKFTSIQMKDGSQYDADYWDHSCVIGSLQPREIEESLFKHQNSHMATERSYYDDGITNFDREFVREPQIMYSLDEIERFYEEIMRNNQYDVEHEYKNF